MLSHDDEPHDPATGWRAIDKALARDWQRKETAGPTIEAPKAHSLSRLWQQPLARKPFSGIGRDGDLFVLYSGGKEVCRGSMDYCRRRQRALLEDDE